MNYCLFHPYRWSAAIKYLLMIVLAVISWVSGAYATTTDWVQDSNTAVRIFSAGYTQEEQTTYLHLGIHYKLEKNWHIYGKEESEVGFPPTINWQGSTNIGESEIIWPPSTRLVENIGGIKIESFVYKDEVVIPIKVKVINPAEQTNIAMKVDYALCSEICIPATASFAFAIPAGYFNAEIMELLKDSFPPSHPESGLGALLWILFLALIGGVILNVMPCVLPVLSIKLLNIVKHGDNDIPHIRFHFILTALGNITAFVILALVIIGLQTSGKVVGWGFHFQEPIFLITMIIILMAFAFNMWGVYEIHLPAGLNQFLHDKLANISLTEEHDEHDHAVQSFFEGMFATILATPCTAPFLGTAIGFGLSRTPVDIILIFTSIGVGMAMPYFILCLFPKWVYHMPKPGDWMVKVKYFLGILLALTAIWLGWVLYNQSFNHTDLQEPQGVWQPFDHQAISGLVAQGKIVIVDVTADWCITCKVNKAAVLDDQQIVDILKHPNVVAMQADWTKRSDVILAYLQEHERYGIPFNIIYGPDQPNGVILSELLTIDDVVYGFEQAGLR